MRNRELLELRAVVSGHVQGVGFRAIAKQYAETFHLAGFTRNLADGSVELCAQGRKGELENWLEQLQQRFQREIQNIDFDFHPVTQVYSEFKIF